MALVDLLHKPRTCFKHTLSPGIQKVEGGLGTCFSFVSGCGSFGTGNCSFSFFSLFFF